VYLFARYFGSGVIVATAFIHLLEPAYSAIGPQTCVGMTGGWAGYSWPPAITLTSVIAIFLLDFVADRYVEIKYGHRHDHENLALVAMEGSQQCTHDADLASGSPRDPAVDKTSGVNLEEDTINRSFEQQIAAFIILEFGVIFHSVIIGLNLGVVGSEFAVLFPVIVFHQTFEGLGIGSRMSAIPFPKRYNWLPWLLCAMYGLTTPIAIAIGLGVRTTYDPASFTANVVSGLLDSLSAGILIYTGLVELLARDFLFNPSRTQDNKELFLMVMYVIAGAALMALLGKWA
jgi:solute carrier family 39 (zinc transporter), member 1/2/3